MGNKPIEKSAFSGGKALDCFSANDWSMSHDLPLTKVRCPFCIVLWVKVCFCLFGMVCLLSKLPEFRVILEITTNTLKYLLAKCI